MVLISRGTYIKPLVIVRDGLILFQVECEGSLLSEITYDIDNLAGMLTATTQALVEYESAWLKNIKTVIKEEGNELLTKKVFSFITREVSKNVYVFFSFAERDELTEEENTIQKIIEISQKFKNNLTGIKASIKEEVKNDSKFLKKLFKPISRKETFEKFSIFFLTNL